MSKDTTRKRDDKRVLIVKELATQFNVTVDAVRKAIRGDLKTENGEKINRAFNKKYKELEKVLK